MSPVRMPLMLLAPTLVVIGGLFGGGLVLAALRTVGVTPFAVGGGALSLDAWARAGAEPDLLASVLLTVWVAAASTALATVIGTAAAFTLDRLIGAGRGRTATFLFQVNLAVPHVIAATGTLWLFAQSGFLARLAAAAGLIDEPAGFPVLVYDPSGLGMILAFVWKEVPFVGLVVLGALQAVGDGPRRTARMLGATRLQAFRHVTLPLILPAVTAAATILFAFAIGTYETQALLGASHPRLLPVLAYDMFTSNALSDRPAAIALALGIAAGGFVLIAGWRRLIDGSGR